MRQKFVEITQATWFWSKVLLVQLTREDFDRKSTVSERSSLLMTSGHSPGDIMVLDLDTCEGLVVTPGSRPRDALRKHQVLVCPLMLPFLEYLNDFCSQNGNIEDLPDTVDIPQDAKLGSSERGEPLKELLKLCMKSSDKEISSRARQLWAAEHGNGVPVPGVPITLADFDRWTA